MSFPDSQLRYRRHDLLQNKLFDRVVQWTWILLVVSLPITSQPMVAKFARTGSVAPVAGIFLGFIFIFWFVPYIFKRGEIPKQTIPILVFTLWAVIITLAAFFRENPPYKEISLTSSVLKGLVTLIIGVTFYLVTSSYIRNISIL